MGFFKKKKKEPPVSAPISSVEAYTSNSDGLSQRDATRPYYNVSRIHSRVALPSTGPIEQFNADDNRPRSRQSTSSHTSERLKVRLKKSLSMLFTEKSSPKPNLPNPSVEVN